MEVVLVGRFQFLPLTLKQKTDLMKHFLLGMLMMATLPMSTFAQDNLCANLTTLINSSQEYFKDLRGEETSLEIRGVAKPYQKSTLLLKEGVDMLITADELYPEAVIYLAENRFYSNELEATYTDLKKKIAECLGDQWVTEEKDKTNDIYLEDTEYKKFIAKENKKGKRVKVELFMYNQRELNTWVVELKVFGIGKKL